jgi:hypothetical protein
LLPIVSLYMVLNKLHSIEMLMSLNLHKHNWHIIQVIYIIFCSLSVYYRDTSIGFAQPFCCILAGIM